MKTNTLKICKHINKVNKYYIKIEKNRNINDLKKLYTYVKLASNDFYNKKIDTRYDIIKKYINESIKVYNIKYLLPISFQMKKQNPYSIYLNEIETLEYIINEVRIYLVGLITGNKIQYEKNCNIDFTNFCLKASKKIKEYCDILGIKCKIIDLEPGYDKNYKLFDGNGYHFFNIIEINQNKYIIDVTYKQFFTIADNCKEMIGLMEYYTPLPGYFMMMNEKRKEIATEIIKKGYIKLDNEILKEYLDGFTMSYRNGLYYEQTNDYTFTTNYTINDYIKFLTGEDSQIKREGKEVLGFQKRPIKKT